MFDTEADLDIEIACKPDQITVDFVVQTEPYRLYLTRASHTPGVYQVLFGHKLHQDPLGTTGTGLSQRVFSVVMSLMRAMVHHTPPDHQILGYYWTALGSSRQRLYLRLMKRVAQDLAWSCEQDPSWFAVQTSDREKLYLVYGSAVH